MANEFSTEPSESQAPFSSIDNTIRNLQSIRQEAANDYVTEIREATSVPPEELLGQAATELTDRMRFLYRHPHLLKVLGGSSVRMEAQRRTLPHWTSAAENQYDLPADTIVTPLLMGMNATIVGERSTEISDGFRFSTGIKKDSTTIVSIKHEVSVDGLDPQEESTKYSVIVRPDGNVHVGGGPFEAYRASRGERHLEAARELYRFLDRHPEFDIAYLEQADTEVGEAFRRLTEQYETSGQPVFPEEYYNLPLYAVMKGREELEK
ncbi:MAG TPA: hypothetical protein VHT70_04700 [Candidatus Saccharimonadales bacterium]|jgi:hypothetical protein|nr:hypothetical protein [Candidatus Saccharimonadales bacterium]